MFASNHLAHSLGIRRTCCYPKYLLQIRLGLNLWPQCLLLLISISPNSCRKFSPSSREELKRALDGCLGLASKRDCPKAPKMSRVLQFNVFEDGLADTPDAVGFAPQFREQFDVLLQELSSASADGKTPEFHIFRRTRDFQQLPESVRLIKTSRFFGHLSNLYSIIFHHLGGEARLTAVKDDDTDVYIRSCIRTLFLKSKQVRADLWITPMFGKELEKATANLAAGTTVHEVKTLIRELREQIFDPKTGTIQLDLSLEDPHSLGTRLWKREWQLTGLYSAQLRAFIASLTTLSEQDNAVLRRFMGLRFSPASFPPDHGEDPTGPLIQVELDPVSTDDEASTPLSSRLRKIRCPTLQAAVQAMLMQLCHHARNNPAAPKAVARFLKSVGGGAGVDPERTRVFVGRGQSASSQPWRGWARDIARLLLSAMQQWDDSALLSTRHTKVHRVVKAVNPDLATFVEFDQEWRKLPLPGSGNDKDEGPIRDYALAPGGVAAVIMYDRNTFALVDPMPAGLSPSMRSPHRRAIIEGDGVKNFYPKASSLALLRRLADGVLFLVAAVHFESGPPSMSSKVRLRAAQLQAVLEELQWSIRRLVDTLPASTTLMLVLGGDFNALREEFVFGNTAAFFNTPRVAAVSPPLARPDKNHEAYAPEASTSGKDEPTRSKIASLGPKENGSPLRLRVGSPVSDDGWITEASLIGAGRGCTRSGQRHMVIDYILVGSVCQPPRSGGSKSEVKQQCIQGLVKTWAVRTVSAKKGAEACDPRSGGQFAVQEFGSDHLPVATDMLVAAQC